MIKENEKKILNKDSFHYIIEGPVSGSKLMQFPFHEELDAYRPSANQQEAMIKVANREDGKVYIARNDTHIFAYIVFIYPDKIEHWSKTNISEILELGAIEVAKQYRGYNIAKALLKASFENKAMEDYIVFTTLYYWHWDLKGTNLNIWQYRKVMVGIMESVGLKVVPTNEPDILTHPANALMVRIGEKVPEAAIEAFDKLRYSS